jgi:CDP-glucose 4,6-dehydratase
VLLTGHTGFKGAWLALWLQTLGARVSGFSVSAPTRPSLYELARVDEGMQTRVGDVRDADALAAAVAAARPEVIVHMAAQPLVRRAYAAPKETYEINVIGTVNVLEAVRRSAEVRVAINVTSDKCYANRPQGAPWSGYREDDALGGEDPYSSSKAAAELATEAYRASFFAGGDDARVATARAGNVIGGGDWGEDRLVPDLMRAALAGETAFVRNPRAVRPWQHVLSPLSGYLVLAQALWESGEYARAWNFGPDDTDACTVQSIVEGIAERWPDGVRWQVAEPARGRRSSFSEAHHLKIDSSDARERLGWRPPLDLERALDATVAWYRELREGADPRALTIAQVSTLSEHEPRAAA